MKWERGHQSAEVEDRRGRRGGGGLKLAGGGIGAVVILLVAAFIFGPEAVLENADLLAPKGGSEQGPAKGGGADPDKELVEFVSFVFDDIQKTWARKFKAEGKTYKKARLVIFTDAVQSACGYTKAAVGPFYCPADHKAYVDLSFYRDLKSRFGAPGDFAQAYVIAHEVGHHVQNLLGTSGKVHRMERAKPDKANALSVKLELQADCYAGVWAHDTSERDLLERGDIEEGLRAASAIGDDTLQKRAGRRVQPESWTHGSSKQRMKWFSVGLKAGDLGACDTFEAP